MSGKLAPSKSTVYLANLPFALTNSDIHKLLEKYGRVVRVTIMKDRQTRRSKGVAFVLFLHREEAAACAAGLDGHQLFGRTLRASLARDNGRAAEFVRRREYPDKSRCYECGETGHLSYSCPQNTLGERPPPPKRPRKKRRKPPASSAAGDAEEEEEDEGEDPREESLAAAIRHEQELREREAVGPSGQRSPPREATPPDRESWLRSELELSD
ncbi:zinc finger CCHC-type and RNA-binding motif-containing protein 1-like [Amphibalanus amphitrite]|nr:zinc finger CCHC-type and RNA-binding motif-containing protein 1-like [Amphibalanus amphitrite]XP_043243233.1 zinc finger CCHC-type and RNA-binding motif-containing protein 1-like [Amphibalanus amphitrite]XP_043243234.1 zinc finger CCHC-type and RNA-binding motif-containing protein 1-like [Amphibalanus amphitrite]